MKKTINNVSPYVVPGLKGRSKIVFKNFEQRVLESFCSVNLCTLEQIEGERRFKELVAVRQAFSLWAKENTKLSLAKIGKMINKDHATVLHSYRTAINRLYVKDEIFVEINKKCLSTIKSNN